MRKYKRTRQKRRVEQKEKEGRREGEGAMETCRIQNPDIPRASRVGAPGGTARRGRAGLGANRAVWPIKASSVYSPRGRRNVA